mmetsp:Transcript_8905/g.21058  ORF Transcript_8905/g.21058 Transcript_8905/m.21058 type:complete len:435 (+) Transcript_8905:607-1911(+)
MLKDGSGDVMTTPIIARTWGQRSWICRKPEWPERDEAEFARGKAELQSMRFDALSFDGDVLQHLALEIFMELDVVEKLDVSITKLKAFIMAVRHSMFDNPYHNWEHAFDVTQTVYSLGLASGTFGRLETLEQYALILSALCHDLEHPGVNNPFLVSTKSALAMLYNDQSVLENHHCCRAFQIMCHKEVGLLEELSPADYFKLRKVIISNILATDMARHAEYMSRLRKFAEAEEGAPVLEPQFEMEVLMKSADTSNVLKPFSVCKKWAVRVTEEFFGQGDKEKARDLNLTPMCDRDSQGRVALQKGFIDFVVGPFYTLVGKVLPGAHEAMQLMAQNRKEWDDYSDERLLREDSEERAAREARVEEASLTRLAAKKMVEDAMEVRREENGEEEEGSPLVRSAYEAVVQGFGHAQEGGGRKLPDHEESIHSSRERLP